MPPIGQSSSGDATGKPKYPPIVFITGKAKNANFQSYWCHCVWRSLARRLGLDQVNVLYIFYQGGPGGEQVSIARTLVRRYQGWVHLSADLLVQRAAQRTHSDPAHMIASDDQQSLVRT